MWRGDAHVTDHLRFFGSQTVDFLGVISQYRQLLAVSPGKACATFDTESLRLARFSLLRAPLSLRGNGAGSDPANFRVARDPGAIGLQCRCAGEEPPLSDNPVHRSYMKL